MIREVKMEYYLEFRRRKTIGIDEPIMEIETTPQVPPFYREGDILFLDEKRGFNVVASKAIIKEDEIRHVIIVER